MYNFFIVHMFDWSNNEMPSVPYELKPSDIEGYKNTRVGGDPASGSMEFYESFIKRIMFIYDKINNSAIIVQDSTIYTGDNWSPIDNFDDAFDKEGNVIDFQNIKVEGSVDSNQTDIYEVKYSYDGVTSIAKITIKKNETTLKVKDSTLSVGDKWGSADNFVSVTDKEGVDDLKVKGTIDTSVAGFYEVMYKNGNKVTVKEKPSISTSNGDQGGKQSQDKGGKNKQGTNNAKNSLPKAGEQSEFYLSVMGIIILLSGLVMIYRKLKK